MIKRTNQILLEKGGESEGKKPVGNVFPPTATVKRMFHLIHDPCQILQINTRPLGLAND